MKLVRKSVLFSKQSQSGLLVLIVLLLSSACLLSQSPQKPSRQSSLEAFSKGDYELAYSQFNELLVTYPGDPIYKYYSGVCLVKLGRDPGNAVALLKQALQGTAAVRSIPTDAHFWLGRAQQMAGRFTEAIASFTTYTGLNGKKAAKDLGIPEFITQCEKKEGRLTEAETSSDPKQAEQKQVVRKEEVNTVQVIEKPGPEIYVTDTVPGDYDRILSDALDLQYRADSVYKNADEQKQGLTEGTYAERTKLKAKISVTESLADSLQKLADKKYDEAQSAMNQRPFAEIYVNPDSAKESAEKAEPAPPATVKKDTVKTEAAYETLPAKPLLDSVPPVKAKIAAEEGTVDLFSVFEVKKKAPDEKIPLNPPLPRGLVYRIQVAVFRNPVDYSHFRGIVPVNGFTIQGKDLTVYYAGMFRKLADANKALPVVRKLGFRDAFVAALMAGKTITQEKAAVLEKEWAKKPVATVLSKQVPADTIPPALTFRVEVLRSAKPVRDDVIDGIKRIAGARGLEIVALEDKTMVYLIGTFITYDSASEYTDLLKRNGYDNAKVGAWLGKKEMPVETARELFEHLE
ncbi:MAG: tetratricopeptide repeat protein [Bacteroidota bacterium]